MPIHIDNKALEDALEAIGKQQPTPMDRPTTMARHILMRAVEACTVQRNPLAWMPNGLPNPDPPTASGSA